MRNACSRPARRVCFRSGSGITVTTESARDWRVRWRLFFSEVIGTAVLVFGGVSMVIVMSGDGGPMGWLERVRRALTAFSLRLRGNSGRPVADRDREWGHINPAVTMGFWLLRKLDTRAAVGSIVGGSAGGGRLSWCSSTPGVGSDG